MKREQYKVAVNSAEEAEMYKQALLSLGEKLDLEFFDYTDYPKMLVFSSAKDWILVNTRHSILSKIPETITFKELIKLLVNAKEPLMVSMDGVDLYEGDEAHHVYKDRIDGYKYNGTFYPWLNNHEFVFSTKEAALKWIEKENKVKEIEVDLFNKSHVAIVSLDKITIDHKKGTPFEMLEFLKPSDIEDIYHELKQLSDEK